MLNLYASKAHSFYRHVLWIYLRNTVLHKIPTHMTYPNYFSQSFISKNKPPFFILIRLIQCSDFSSSLIVLAQRCCKQSEATERVFLMPPPAP